MCARIDQAAQPGENRARCLPLCAPLYFSCGLHTTHGCCSGVTHQHGGLISLRGVMHCKHAPHPPAHRGCLLTQALFAPTPSPSCSIPVPKVCPQMSPLPLICSPLCCPRPHKAWGSHSTRALLHSSSPCPCGCVPSVPISWESQSPPPSQHQAVTVAFWASSPVQDQHNKRIRVRRAEIQKKQPQSPVPFPSCQGWEHGCRHGPSAHCGAEVAAWMLHRALTGRTRSRDGSVPPNFTLGTQTSLTGVR